MVAFYLILLACFIFFSQSRHYSLPVKLKTGKSSNVLGFTLWGVAFAFLFISFGAVSALLLLLFGVSLAFSLLILVHAYGARSFGSFCIIIHLLLLFQIINHYAS